MPEFEDRLDVLRPVGLDFEEIGEMEAWDNLGYIKDIEVDVTFPDKFRNLTTPLMQSATIRFKKDLLTRDEFVDSLVLRFQKKIGKASQNLVDLLDGEDDTMVTVGDMSVYLSRDDTMQVYIDLEFNALPGNHLPVGDRPFYPRNGTMPLKSSYGTLMEDTLQIMFLSLMSGKEMDYGNSLQIQIRVWISGVL